MTIKELMTLPHKPAQVMFYDGENYSVGILFGDQIICGCCGGVFEVEDVIDLAREEGVPPVKFFKNWVDLSDEIRGDDKDCATATAVEM